MKTFGILLTAAFCICILSGCSCQHTWAEASCTMPKVCTLCEETEGEPLGHSWAEAACETPETCTRCGVTNGEAPGHQWQEADCERAKICTVCAESEGEALGHSFGEWIFGTESIRHTCQACALEEVLTPEQYARELLVGTWYAAFIVWRGEVTEYPGHCVVFTEDGTGTLELDSRMSVPEQFRLCFEGYDYRDLVQAWSFDFYLEGIWEDEWEEIPREYGIIIRLLVYTKPDFPRAYDVNMTYLGYSATWSYQKETSET